MKTLTDIANALDDLSDLTYNNSMKRIALLIGNSNGLEGVKKDLSAWKKFLLSPKGGAWKLEEIKTIMNPPKQELLHSIEKLKYKGYDLAIVVYSGHGGYDKSTILEINKREETINETDLLCIAPRQISVFDCCRCLVREDEPINESQIAFSTGAKLLDLQKIRSTYNDRILQAKRQQIRLYACSIDETALDTPQGALYIQALLEQAQLFPNDEEFGTVENIHDNAKKETCRRAAVQSHTQHPSAVLPKCLSQQKLILSINPERV